MSAKKVIVVFGATGRQGGAVAHTLLTNPKASAQFSVRAITRDVSKPAAKALAEQGAEVVAADMDDKASLVSALKGAYGVYAVTDFWATMSDEIEIRQGKNIADAAKEAGVQHFIASSLDDVSKASNGTNTGVLHFDSKNVMEQHSRSLKFPIETYLYPGWYMSNFPEQMFRATPGGRVMALPFAASTPIPLFAPERDTGKFVAAILAHPEQTNGKIVYAATEYYTVTEIIDTFKKVFPEAGAGFQYFSPPEDKYKEALVQAGMPQVVVNDLTAMMMWIGEYGYYGGADIKPGHELLDEKLTTWEEYVRETKLWADLK